MSAYEHEREKEHRQKRLKNTEKHRELENSENLNVYYVANPSLMEEHIKMKHPKHIPGWIKTWIIHFLEEIPQQEKDKFTRFDKNTHSLYFVDPQGLDSLERYLSLDPPNPKFSVLVQNKDQAMEMMRKLKLKKLDSSIEGPAGSLLDRIMGIEINGSDLNEKEVDDWRRNVSEEESRAFRSPFSNPWPPRP